MSKCGAYLKPAIVKNRGLKEELAQRICVNKSMLKYISKDCLRRLFITQIG